MYDTLHWKAHQEPKAVNLQGRLYNNCTKLQLSRAPCGAKLIWYAVQKTVGSAQLCCSHIASVDIHAVRWLPYHQLDQLLLDR